IGPQADDLGGIGGGGDADGCETRELTRVATRLVGAVYEHPGQLEVGMLQDPSERELPDVAGAPLRDSVHGRSSLGPGAAAQDGGTPPTVKAAGSGSRTRTRRARGPV